MTSAATRPRKRPRVSDETYAQALATILGVARGRAAFRGPTPWRGAVERRLGRALPPALVTFHALVGDDPPFLRRYHPIEPPDELTITDGLLVIVHGHQWTTHWGVQERDLDRPDPAVWLRARGRREAKRAAPSLSRFLVQTICRQATMSMDAIARTELGPDEVDAALQTIRTRLAPVAGGVYALAEREAFVDVERRVLASIEHDGDGATVYFGASRAEVEAIERALGVSLEWL